MAMKRPKWLDDLMNWAKENEKEFEDDAEKKALDEKENNEKNVSDDSAENKSSEKEVVDDNNKEEDKEMKSIFDEKTGLWKINSEDSDIIKEKLRQANKIFTDNSNKALIEKALSDKVGTVKLNDNISANLVLRSLDRTNIKVEEGKVVGVDEAFDNLKKTDAGLFKAEKQAQQSRPVSSPLNENLNPTNSGVVGGKLSFAEAVASKGNNI